MDFKEQVIEDYLSGGYSLRGLEKKYQISRNVISKWIQIYQGVHGVERTAAQQIQYLRRMKDAKKPAPTQAELAALQEKIALLEKQLEWEKQRVEVLDTLINVAEKQLNIPIRKKPGSSQSKK
jgi:transposase-like protein